jgi:hypothetical protein
MRRDHLTNGRLVSATGTPSHAPQSSPLLIDEHSLQILPSLAVVHPRGSGAAYGESYHTHGRSWLVPSLTVRGGGVMEKLTHLEEWQTQAVIQLILRPLLARARAADDRYAWPPPAVMVITYGPTEAPTGQVAYTGAIRVLVTFPNGEATALGFEELWTLLERHPERIRAVEPLTTALTFILYLHDRLLAWDIRNLVVASTDDPEVRQSWGRLGCGPTPARDRRLDALALFSEEERAQVLRDTIIRDVMEPGRKRVPLRGLEHRGGASFETGTAFQPFRVLKYLDDLLGLDRKAAIPEHALSRKDRRTYETAAAPPLRAEREAGLPAAVAALPPQQHAAVLHWLRAREQGLTLKEYCSRASLNYKTVDKAYRDGLTTLRTSGWRL